MTAKRRTNVEPGIYRRPDGRLEIGWRDSTGRQRWKVVSGGIKAARADLATEVAKRATGEVVAASPRLTFNSAADAWWDARAVRLRPASQATYGCHLKVLRRQFGTQRLTAITPSAVASYLAREGAKGAAGWTLKGRCTVLSGVFTYATRRLGHNMPNPVKALDHVERPSTDDQTVKRVLSDAELACLIEATDAPHRLLVQLIAETGCRKSEAAGLIWESVDLDAMTVRVDAQLDRHTGERVPTKTRRSVRTIVITPSLTAALKVRRLASGDRDGLVFRRPGGKPYGHNAIDGLFRTARKRAGLDGVTPHGLRHTHASRLIAAGWDVAEIAARLGDSIPTVMSIYAHEFDAAGRRDEQRDRLAALYGGSAVEATGDNRAQQTALAAGANVTPLLADAV